MNNKQSQNISIDDLQKELEEVKLQLEEANSTIEAIRTGQIDALVVQSENGHQLYTLKTADHTYRLFIEKMSEGAVTLNQQGTILYCNSKFAEMVHLPLSQVIGMPFNSFVAGENAGEYASMFEQCWTGDCKGEIFILTGEHRIPVQLSLTTLQLEEGVSLSIILTDLTKQKAAQEQLKSKNEQLAKVNLALEASNTDLQQFASVASHDLQEPLRKIQVFSNLMKSHKSELTDESRKYLQKIIDSSARMKKLILDILNYSRLSANDASFECVDLNKLLEEIKEDFDLVVEEKKAVIEVQDLPCIDVNKGQIRQVFQNIISNALKFSIGSKDPFIRITSKRIKELSFDSEEQIDGPYCLIEIKDNGIGFDEQYVSNIFALFERLNSKDKYEGTGIGMAVAKKIVEKHNGIITAYSKANEGATFCIILPVTHFLK